MTVNVYRSTDASAPTLTGQAGSFTALLDACLVSGYGSLAAAGWIKPFTSVANLGVYNQGGGNLRYLRVDDTGTTDARAHAFEAMSSDADFSSGWTLSLGAPTSSTGFAIKKSSTADATARGWVVIATNSVLYVFIEPTSTPAGWNASSTSTSGNGQFFFGDFISYRPSDTYNTAIIGATSTTAGNGQFGTCSSSITTAALGHFICRNYLGLGQGGIGFNLGMPGAYGGQSVLGSTTSSMPFPDLITGGMTLVQADIGEVLYGGHLVRGRMPGLWTSINSLAATHGDVITGTGVLAGKTFQSIAVWGSSTVGRAFIEISNTW